MTIISINILPQLQLGHFWSPFKSRAGLMFGIGGFAAAAGCSVAQGTCMAICDVLVRYIVWLNLIMWHRIHFDHKIATSEVPRGLSLAEFYRTKNSTILLFCPIPWCIFSSSRRFYEVRMRQSYFVAAQMKPLPPPSYDLLRSDLLHLYNEVRICARVNLLLHK